MLFRSDLLTRVITDAIAAGLKARSANVKEEAKSEAPAAVAAGEPLADWEKEILDGTAATPAADAPTTPEA